MSQIDWSRAVVVVRAPVVHTASEDIQEFEVPLAYLVPDEGYRTAVMARIGGTLPLNVPPEAVDCFYEMTGLPRPTEGGEADGR